MDAKQFLEKVDFEAFEKLDPEEKKAVIKALKDKSRKQPAKPQGHLATKSKY